MGNKRSKTSRGLCMWRCCLNKAIGGKPKSFQNEEWVFPLYCHTHGLIVQAQRLQKIREEERG